ncbi:nuclear transport factor 2 family protein [Nocardioides panacisoli]|uniref:nuclear transport factor 2 family protein n=1 Tax=Nocardioides panacisoli TaxID=627624 RepID=UPI001C627547|nr:nuclear transport factor 2 family protein [Nocardioides panacisoli]QYJ02895.1 nuclear transport factor 2 family protein [Nocardioides panacisoli]
MTADRQTILGTIQRYVDLVATGTADEVVALYADGATIEDPVGSGVLDTPAAIAEFYAAVEPLEQRSRLGEVRIAGNEAAFGFELVTQAGGRTFTLAPIDVMSFDDEGRITSMRAYWSTEDMVRS